MNEPTSYLDKPMRSYEGAVEDIRRKERERICAVLDRLSNGALRQFAGDCLRAAAEAIRKGEL